jgi:predicted dehydrogenase
MANEITRRRLLQNAALTGAGIWAASRTADARVLGANDRLNIGLVGVANRGRDDLDGVKSENIVAICDIDDNYLARVKMEYPNATTYNDFRKMMEQKDIDAVVVATPDHVHAAASSAAILSGRHIYCEKPLAHSVFEVRRVTELAHKHNRVSQMGTQIHAENNYRRVVEMIQADAIGPVREVHVWVERVWAGGEVPADTPPVPENLHWDLWLGPAKERPYSPVYLPGNWRGWWAFGNGTLGDMACHHMDLPWWALDLNAPTKVSAEGPPVSAEVTPPWLIVHYEFPARGSKPPVNLTWYHGRKRPEYFAQGKLPTWRDGTLFVGEKGMLIADYGERKLLPEKDFVGYVPPKPTIPESIGHHKEWIEACKHGGTTTCNFNYSGPLTEAVLLGAVAYRTGTTIDWDSKRLKAKDCPEADAILKPTYRDGWTV